MTNEAAIRALALFRHAPRRTDVELDAIELLARDLAGEDMLVFAAREGLALDPPALVEPGEGGHGTAVLQM